MLCMQVVNEHHRQQDVWSWRRLDQWSPFTCIQSTLSCLKVFSYKTSKTDGGSKRTGENLSWSKRGKKIGKCCKGVEGAHWTTLSHHQLRCVHNSRLNDIICAHTPTNTHYFWHGCCHIKTDSTKSDLSPLRVKTGYWSPVTQTLPGCVMPSIMSLKTLQPLKET